MAVYLKKRRTVIEEWKRISVTGDNDADKVELPFEPFEKLGVINSDIDLNLALPPGVEVDLPESAEGDED